jgi:hypothetical protein
VAYGLSQARTAGPGDAYCYHQAHTNGPGKAACRSWCETVVVDTPDITSEFCSDRNLNPRTYALLAAQGRLPATRTFAPYRERMV